MTCPLPKSCFCWPTLRRSNSAGSVTSSDASRGNTRRWVLLPLRKTALPKQRHVRLHESRHGLHPGVRLICRPIAEPSRSSPADSSSHQGSPGEDGENFIGYRKCLNLSPTFKFVFVFIYLFLTAITVYTRYLPSILFSRSNSLWLICTVVLVIFSFYKNHKIIYSHSNIKLAMLAKRQSNT